MKTQLKRREFILKGCMASVAGCALLSGARLYGMQNLSFTAGDEKPDPKKLNYCGYTCPDNCKMKKASLENDPELKQEAYKEFRIQEKYGIEFDADKIFCYGCKTQDKPVGPVVEKCTVRNCAIAKGYDCCIQCEGLSACDKEIWKTFPDFHKSMIELQKKYNGV